MPDWRDVNTVKNMTKELEEKVALLDTPSGTRSPNSVLSREIYNIRVARELKIKEIRKSFKLVVDNT